MRKRKKLEVSTFPFLAVLLCTMGSLILLLLVMDKKAKKAALEKAYENAWNQSKALQAKADADEKNTEADKKEWIKLKSEQHNDLLKKESALEQEITLLKNELALIEKGNQRSNINISSEDLTEKELALSSEKSKLYSLVKKLESEKTTADKNLKETKDLTEKIVSMELILKELKASIDKSKFAYSIVPYFGKNGLNRKPLYIECNENGILLFPDKTLIPSNDESDNLKTELLNRTSQLREFLLQTLGPKDSTPYLMILVRPGGITNYWKLQSVIKPMDIDFGYELVDKIWVLDIPADQSAPSPSNLAAMIKPMPIPKPIPAPGNIRGGINNGNGSIPQTNTADINKGIYQNGNEKKNSSSGNPKSISYGATAQNIRPITALPGFDGKENLNNTLAKNNQDFGNNLNQGLGKDNSNGTGIGKDNSNGTGTGKENSNGSGSGTGKNNSNGTGTGTGIGKDNSNRTGSGTGLGKDNSNGTSTGTGKENSNGSGSGSGTGKENSNGTGLGIGKNNSNGTGTGKENSNGSGTGTGKENSKSFENAIKNNPNNPTGAGAGTGNNSNSTQPINNGNASGGSGTSVNSGANSTGGIPGSKGAYSVTTPINSLPGENESGKKGTGAGSSGDDKNSSKTNEAVGGTSQKGEKSNSTSNNESVKSGNGSSGEGAQPSSQDNNPNISISINNKNKNETNVTTNQNSPRTTYNREDESQSNSEAKDPTARIAAPLPELGPRKSSAPTPLRAARLFADRDWVIYVECKFEEILVHPNRLIIPTSLLASEEGVKRFVQEIEKIIQRKQSTVRSGEPPYRPEVRFLVWPDGLKPYHLSYPALQLAGIKQKRQNLESEDSINEIIQGR
ncbi:MAG: hypothetical protein NTZ30_01560 [Planctomycetota bacterium]|nr:hypothetical protein [Planctomycetota bacterium]